MKVWAYREPWPAWPLPGRALAGLALAWPGPGLALAVILEFPQSPEFLRFKIPGILQFSQSPEFLSLQNPRNP